MDFMCSAVWTKYMKKSEANCAISIEHNLKMGVRPIFRFTVVRFIVIHFRQYFGFFFFFFSIMLFFFHYCFVSSAQFYAGTFYYIWCFQFILSRFTKILCQALRSLLYVCVAFFFTLLYMSYFVHNAHALNRYCCWFL